MSKSLFGNPKGSAPMSDQTHAYDLKPWGVNWTSGELEALNNPQRAVSSLATEHLPALKSQQTGDKSVNFRILLAIASLSGTALAARALGVVNQAVISDHFGTSIATDAY